MLIALVVAVRVFAVRPTDLLDRLESFIIDLRDANLTDLSKG